MSLRFYLIRFMRYYKRQGLQETLKRIKEKIQLALLHRDEVIFYSDLIFINSPPVSKPDNYKIEAKLKTEEINGKDLDCLRNIISAEILAYQFKERFPQSAIMWIIKIDDDLAGYVWSTGKSTMSPSYLQLCNNDVYLFDGLVLPQYRGKNIYPVLLGNVLFELKIMGFVRAFLIAHQWNESVQKSFLKVNTKILAVVRKYGFGRHEYFTWRNS